MILMKGKIFPVKHLLLKTADLLYFQYYPLIIFSYPFHNYLLKAAKNILIKNAKKVNID